MHLALRKSKASTRSRRRFMMRPSERPRQLHSERLTQVLLNWLVEGSRQVVIVGWIVNAWDALGANQVMNFPCHVAKLLPHPLLFLHLGNCQFLLMLMIQVRGGPFSTLGHFLHVPLSSTEVVQMPSAPPSAESSLHDHSSLMEELRLKPPLQLEAQDQRASAPGPAAHGALNQKSAAHHRMPTSADLGRSVDALNLCHCLDLLGQVVARGLG
mmetsp:Transcript_84223/g.133480  ORF Transcript_84223/g.133480 Transcript_84223/m.133480 type:complete len:213 (-) Transcript_84223:100-738(-)